MPIYDYFCPKCKIRVSDILVLAPDDIQICKVCGTRMKRMPSSPNLYFKGDGWTDKFYKSDNDYQGKGEK